MQDIFARVQNIIAEALYLEKAEVERNASLMKDLGAESIDFLDIIFRIEKEFSVKLPKGEVERRARGGLSESEFAQNGLIQEAGLSRLREVMSEVDQAAIKPGLSLRDIPTLFTVGTFERMVQEQLGLTSTPAQAGTSTGKPVLTAV